MNGSNVTFVVSAMFRRLPRYASTPIIATKTAQIGANIAMYIVARWLVLFPVARFDAVGTACSVTDVIDEITERDDAMDVKCVIEVDSNPVVELSPSSYCRKSKK